VLNLRDEIVGCDQQRRDYQISGGERMRRDVSELTNRLNIEKISSHAGYSPNITFTGALKTKDTAVCVWKSMSYSG